MLGLFRSIAAGLTMEIHNTDFLFGMNFVATFQNLGVGFYFLVTKSKTTISRTMKQI